MRGGRGGGRGNLEERVQDGEDRENKDEEGRGVGGEELHERVQDRETKHI